MNSPSTNVAVMYSSENNNNNNNAKAAPPNPNPQPSIASLISDPALKFDPSQPAHFNTHTSMPPPSYPAPDPVLVSDADLLLNLHSPFSAALPRQNSISTSYLRTTQPNQSTSGLSPTFASYPTPSDNSFGDMVIDTQEMDMSLLGADMMPWDLEYLPHDMLYFGDGFAGDGAS
jgi:hypothetical protein